MVTVNAASACMSQALPLLPGWIALRHERHEQPCWLNVASRTVSWTPPYIIDDLGTAATHEPPSAGMSSAPIVEAVLRKQKMWGWEAFHAVETGVSESSHDEANSRSQLLELTPEEAFERELSQQPKLTYGQFLAHCGRDFRGSSRPGSLQSIPIDYLHAYATAVLGARVHAQMDVPADGPWAQPPHRCRIVILGIVISESMHTNKEMARALAYEEAALTVCPHGYAEELRWRSLRPPRVLRPVITDVSIPAKLSVEDERVLDLDLSVTKSPAMMVG